MKNNAIAKTRILWYYNKTISYCREDMAVRDFINILCANIKSFDGTQDELAVELTQTMDDLFKNKSVKASRTFTRILVAKQKSCKVRITEDELLAYMETLNIREEDRNLMKELYQPYIFWNFTMDENRRQQVAQITEVFRSLRTIADLQNNPRPSEHYDTYNPYPDGLISDQNSISLAVTTELIREFNRENPTIDVFLPQDMKAYYDKIQSLFRSNLDGKKINIRQILTFPKYTGKNTDKQEFDILAFLPTIYFLTYAVKDSYHFYYSNSTDSVISEIDGLILPYYFCTSDCLIRFSQQMHKAWVSHNETDVKIYHQMFDVRLSHSTVKPLLKNFKNQSEMIGFYAAKEVLDIGYTMEPCYVHYISDVLIQKYLRKDIDNETSTGIVMFTHFADNQQYHVGYFNKNSIFNFAKNGRMNQYSSFLNDSISPHDRILIIKSLLNQTNDSTLGDFIVKDYAFNTNEKYGLGISRNTITVYPMDLDYTQCCVIEEKSLVEAFRFFFTEYLPNSDLIYSPQKTCEILENAIQIASDLAEKESGKDESTEA